MHYKTIPNKTCPNYNSKAHIIFETSVGFLIDYNKSKLLLCVNNVVVK